MQADDSHNSIYKDSVSASFAYPASFATSVLVLKIAATKKAVTASKAMTKDAIAEAIAASCKLKKSVCAKSLNVLAEVSTQEMKKTGVFAVSESRSSS